MRYSKRFKKVVKLDTFIGMGNPNSEILIVGKEVATDTEEGKDKELENKNIRSFNRNFKDWTLNIAHNTKQHQIPDWTHQSDSNNPLYAFKGITINKEGHTWRKYQKLHDYIFEKENNNKIDFQENIFITEMSVLPSKTTSKAQEKKGFREKLNYRKHTFFRSEFIQHFPIVILACSNYISGGEITDIFNVKFIKEVGEKAQRYWIHYNIDKTKLVIHTRQLSANVSNNLLKNMAFEIKKMLKKIN